MKLFSAILLLFLSLNICAQKTDGVLATANGQDFTVIDLAPDVRRALENLPDALKETRGVLLERQITDSLFEQEAAARKMTVEKLIESEVKAKTPAPTEAEIKAVYEANRARVGSQTLEEIRPQIIAFLKQEADKKTYSEFLSNLQNKYKVTLGKDINAPNLTVFETLATVGDQTISVRTFDTKHKQTLSELEAGVYYYVKDAIEQIVYSTLLVAEAKAQNVSAGDFVGREISGKMKTDSEAERAALESALREKLFIKYNAKFFVKEIPPIVQIISTENQPSKGKINAPVIVVMFTDFQCPACSAVHPVLQEVLTSYGEKVRFVVRDYPLVNLHENAFRAALAANAANAQGKFFEYTDVLYQNQSQLDDKSLVEYASRLGLDAKRFEADLKTEKFAADVERDIADGKKLNLPGTPSIFVNGERVRTLSAEKFRQAIDKALKK